MRECHQNIYFHLSCDVSWVERRNNFVEPKDRRELYVEVDETALRGPGRFRK
jgi:hypothetical protein